MKLNSLKTCQRKTSYTKREAQDQQRMKIRQKGIHGSIYKCQFCHKYHITSMPGINWKLLEKDKNEN